MRKEVVCRVEHVAEIHFRLWYDVRANIRVNVMPFGDAFAVAIDEHIEQKPQEECIPYLGKRKENKTTLRSNLISG